MVYDIKTLENQSFGKDSISAHIIRFSIIHGSMQLLTYFFVYLNSYNHKKN